MDFNNIDFCDMTVEQSRAWSQQVVDQLMADDDTATKQAAMSMTDYVRPTNREMSFCQSVLSPAPWDENERVPAPDHDHPMIYIEVEPEAPGGQMVDFGYTPNTFYPFGKRMPLTITLVRTDRIVKEVIELGAYKYNFRTVLTDLMSLQLAALKDSRFMQAVAGCLGSANTNLPLTGKPNYLTTNSALTYAHWLDFLDIMRRQPNKLEPAIVLINQLEISSFKTMLATTFTGTELAADMWRNGFASFELKGDNVKLVATIKDALVAKDEYYAFSAENRLGRCTVMYEPTMLVKNEGLKISFSQYEALGMSIVNYAAIAKKKFNV